MDLLDPLSNSENEIIESKVIINESGEIVKSVESDEEQHVGDALSPQTLLETPENDMQYSLRSSEGMITYRVLQVEDGAVEAVPQISGYPISGTQQVLTGNLNGQLYVIGNANEVFSTQSGTRAIAPRSVIDTNNTTTPNFKKRDERRRATHNEVERRRRDKINNWISKLSKIIPENSPSDTKGNGHYDGQSKGGILAKACDYITELKEVHQKYQVCLKEYKHCTQALEVIKQKNQSLERENKALKEVLKRSGIELPSDIM